MLKLRFLALALAWSMPAVADILLFKDDHNGNLSLEWLNRTGGSNINSFWNYAPGAWTVEFVRGGPLFFTDDPRNISIYDHSSQLFAFITARNSDFLHLNIWTDLPQFGLPHTYPGSSTLGYSAFTVGSQPVDILHVYMAAGYADTVQYQFVPAVPEPSAVWLLGTAIVALASKRLIGSHSRRAWTWSASTSRSGVDSRLLANASIRAVTDVAPCRP